MSDLERSRMLLDANLLFLVDDETIAASQRKSAEAAAAVDRSSRNARRPRVRRKRFAERTAGQARAAASVWLRDFSRHGPLQIRRIATRRCSNLFLTEVTYTRG